MAITNVHSPFLETHHYAGIDDCMSFNFAVDDAGAQHVTFDLSNYDTGTYSCPFDFNITAGNVTTSCMPIAACFPSNIGSTTVNEINVILYDSSWSYVGEHTIFSGTAPLVYVGTSTVQYDPTMSADGVLISAAIFISFVMGLVSYLATNKRV